MSSNLNQRSNAFFLVLNDNEFELFRDSDRVYKKITKEFEDVDFIALIQHKDEWDDENHRVKTNHFHVVLTLKYNKVSTLNYVLNRIAKIFYANLHQISIEKATDICSCVRYLIHLDNVDKVQYVPFDIVSNNYGLVGDFLSRIREIRDIKEVVEIAKRYNYKTEEIMLHIGHSNWKKWRVEFNDLKRDFFYR